MNGFTRFIQYHNAVPIALGILVLGGASVFAATEPETIFSAEQKVISVDNTYIAEKNLSSFTPQIQVTNVTEDEENYFVAYTFTTIDVQDYVWRDVEKNGTMSVAKSVLGEYGDLGVYVAGQLGQNIDHEIDRLKEAQTIERKNVTQKTVATAYGGLVGKLLDDTTEVFPGYTPVVTPPPLPAPEQTAAVASQDTGAQNPVDAPAQTAPPAPTPTTVQGPLTREEVEKLIRDRVAELLAEGNTSAVPPQQVPTNFGVSPPSESAPVAEPAPAPTSESTPTVVEPTSDNNTGGDPSTTAEAGYGAGTSGVPEESPPLADTASEPTPAPTPAPEPVIDTPPPAETTETASQ